MMTTTFEPKKLESPKMSQVTTSEPETPGIVPGTPPLAAQNPSFWHDPWAIYGLFVTDLGEGSKVQGLKYYLLTMFWKAKVRGVLKPVNRRNQLHLMCQIISCGKVLFGREC